MFKLHANTRITWSIGDLQIGQPFAMFGTVSTVAQKREWPHGTSTTLSRGAMRQTTHIAGTAAVLTATVAVSATDGVESTTACWPLMSSSTSLLSSEATWNASVCAPRVWLMARRNWSLEYEPLSYRLMHAWPLYVRHSADFASFSGDEFPHCGVHCGVLQARQESVHIHMCNLYPVAQVGTITFEDVVSPRTIISDTQSLLMYPGPSFSRSWIFQSFIFFGPPFSGPENSALPTKLPLIGSVYHVHSRTWRKLRLLNAPIFPTNF